MAKLFSHEYMFEKDLRDGVEARGWYPAHLTGPDGWPDLSIFKGKTCRNIEVKIQRGRKMMSDIIEATQAAFWYRTSTRVYTCLCIQYDDGVIGIMEIKPMNALKIRNWPISEFRRQCIEYIVFNNAIKYLTMEPIDEERL